ncbi:MAG: hypothetical protein V8R98_03390 [Holdemanella sp.]
MRFARETSDRVLFMDEGKLLTVKYDNKFFIKCMGLVTGAYMKAQ